MPASEEQIANAESALGMTFSKEYRKYLKSFGVISYGANEFYGLGVKDTSHLNIVNAVNDFRQIRRFPLSLIPITEIGDGHYYMYDNASETVVVVSLPDIGIKKVESNLEKFLSKVILDQ